MEECWFIAGGMLVHSWRNAGLSLEEMPLSLTVTPTKAIFKVSTMVWGGGVGEPLFSLRSSSVFVVVEGVSVGLPSIN